MKRLKLRKWAEYSLIIINILAFIVMASECESTKVFIISHLIAAIIFVLNSHLLIKYTDLAKED